MSSTEPNDTMSASKPGIRRFWINADRVSVAVHAGLLTLAIIRYFTDIDKSSIRLLYLIGMELASLIYHAAYIVADEMSAHRKEGWRDTTYNRAKWSEYSITAALGAITLVDSQTFSSCESYTAYVVIILSMGVIQQQIGAQLDYSATFSVSDKLASKDWDQSLYPIDVVFLFVAAWIWQMFEFVIVARHCGVPNTSDKALVLLPYILFYSAFGIACGVKLKQCRPLTTQSQKALLRDQFEALYAVLGTVSKAALFSVAYAELEGGKVPSSAAYTHAKYVGIGALSVGSLVLLLAISYIFTQKVSYTSSMY